MTAGMCTRNCVDDKHAHVSTRSSGTSTSCDQSPRVLPLPKSTAGPTVAQIEVIHVMKSTVRRTFVTGLLIALPLLVTFWVVRFLFGQLDRAVTPLVVRLIRLLGLGQWLEIAWADYFAPLVSVALALFLIYLLGLVGGNVIGRQALHAIDRLLMQVPFVRGIYSATRQFLDTFSQHGGPAFSRVVLVEYPRLGLWTMAFVTNDTNGEVQVRTERKVLSVFIPTTPNPTSGWLLFVPENDIVPLNMSVDDAFKMIISGGILTPPFPAPHAPSTGPAPQPEGTPQPGRGSEQGENGAPASILPGPSDTPQPSSA